MKNLSRFMALILKKQHLDIMTFGSSVKQEGAMI
jgi:hypothetical protein